VEDYEEVFPRLFANQDTTREGNLHLITAISKSLVLLQRNVIVVELSVEVLLLVIK